MDSAPFGEYSGTLVDSWCWGGQIRLAGRLFDGRSFAVVLRNTKCRIFLEPAFAGMAQEVLSKPGIAYESAASTPRMDGAILSCLNVEVSDIQKALTTLSRAGIRAQGQSPYPSDDWLIARGIKNNVRITGRVDPGRRVELVFVDPEIEPLDHDKPALLRWLSIDIETDRPGTITAISLSTDLHEAQSQTDSIEAAPETPGRPPVSEVLFRGPDPGIPEASAFDTEAALLARFFERVREIDPDVITGWSVIDFDLDTIARRAALLGIAFAIGRSDEAASVSKSGGGRSKARIAGRQAVDAMRVVRGSGTRFEDQSLDTVAQAILGVGKTVHEQGSDKLAELDRLYREDPAAFCRYCLTDARLVLGILDKTGLSRLSAHRASLTGVGLDLAWTSIPTFERIYAIELGRRGLVEPRRDEARRVSGASGGMVLDAMPGLFRNVLVLDFRSLYPSIIRTFNVDPLSYQRALQGSDNCIVAPNGARFDREPGILPDLIGRYFSEREKAIRDGDETGTFVYKILMNSFYGVLGAGGCVYARTELAGAITSFGRRFLGLAKAFFEASGLRVLYGDTDSVFVESMLSDSDDRESMMEFGKALAVNLNARISREIREEFDLESHLSIRCEKPYRRFLIPRLRSGLEDENGTARGRAKGYAGLLLEPDGSSRVEVKGMEAVRSDWTPLARRFQTELLGLVFADKDGEAVQSYARDLVAAMRSGALNEELVYRKSLRRPAEDYERMESPQVKAARMMGWTGRKGSIEYLMTSAGAEPREKQVHPIDYQHYLDHQLRPIWEGIAEAANLEKDPFSMQFRLEW